MFEILPMPADLADLPEPDGLYYVAGRKGYHVVMPSAFGKAIVPVAEIPHLPEHKSTIWEDIPPIPAGLVGQVWSFFRAIWEKRHSEAMVYLTRSRETNQYRVFVPPQQTSMGGVHATLDLTKIQRGWQLVGSIHSHCNFGAYHSGTDTHDADGHNGLHITIGHVDKNPAEYAVMISLNKIRWDFQLADITDGTPELVAHPKWWERYVADPTPAATQVTGISRYTPPTSPYLGGPHYPQSIWTPGRGWAAPTTQTAPTATTYATADDAVDAMIRAGYDVSDLEETPGDLPETATWLDSILTDLYFEAESMGLNLHTHFTFDKNITKLETPRSPRLHEMSDAAVAAAYEEYLSE